MRWPAICPREKSNGTTIPPAPAAPGAPPRPSARIPAGAPRPGEAGAAIIMPPPWGTIIIPPPGCPAGAIITDPAPPAPGPLVATLKVGVFCALQAMDQRPAPGTISGWIHVPEGKIDFHWRVEHSRLGRPRPWAVPANRYPAIRPTALFSRLADAWVYPRVRSKVAKAMANADAVPRSSFFCISKPLPKCGG